MAYFVDGHYNKVNYYSNPNVNYPGTGTPTGVADLSDNARVIGENRFSFASLGDESAVCNDESSPSTIMTTISSTTTTSIPSTATTTNPSTTSSTTITTVPFTTSAQAVGGMYKTTSL